MAGRSGEHAGPGFRNLIVWQRAIDLVEAIYRVTKDWPRDELYGLTSQIRRAAVSVPANIAEGRGRVGIKEYGHHLSIAHGSLCEVETHLIIAERLGYLSREALVDLSVSSAEVGRLLNGVTRSLRTIGEDSREYDLTPDA